MTRGKISIAEALAVVRPSIPPHQAIQLLRRQIKKGKILLEKRALIQEDDYHSWVSMTSAVLEKAFGFGGKHIPFKNSSYGPGNERKSLNSQLSLLGSYVEQLELDIEINKSDTSIPCQYMDGMYGIHDTIKEKCYELYKNKTYTEAVEKSFKVVRDRLRSLTDFETGSEAFGKGKLYIKGAAAPNVDKDFNEAVKFLTMAIDRFRNEKSHTSDAKIEDPIRAYQYLMLSSLAMSLLENAEKCGDV